MKTTSNSFAEAIAEVMHPLSSMASATNQPQFASQLVKQETSDPPVQELGEDTGDGATRSSLCQSCGAAVRSECDSKSTQTNETHASSVARADEELRAMSIVLAGRIRASEKMRKEVDRLRLELTVAQERLRLQEKDRTFMAKVQEQRSTFMAKQQEQQKQWEQQKQQEQQRTFIAQQQKKIQRLDEYINTLRHIMLHASPSIIPPAPPILL